MTISIITIIIIIIIIIIIVVVIITITIIKINGSSNRFNTASRLMMSQVCAGQVSPAYPVPCIPIQPVNLTAFFPAMPTTLLGNPKGVVILHTEHSRH